jgi:hypothetical protein
MEFAELMGCGIPFMLPVKFANMWFAFATLVFVIVTLLFECANVVIPVSIVFDKSMSEEEYAKLPL